MKALALSLLAVLLVGACQDEKTKAVTRKPLVAGAGEALLETPVGISQAGYAKSPVLGYKVPDNDAGSPFADMFPASRGVQSAPKAKAILLDDGITQLAIARIDAIFITDILTERTIELAGSELGMDLRGRLILSATHTHATGCRFATSVVPGLLDSLDGGREDAIAHGVDTFDPETTDRIARSIVNALARARASLRPAALGYARDINEDASHDRRCQDDALYGEGNIDKNVRLLRIDEVDDDGNSVAPIALLVNFAIHGTVYGQNNQHLSIEAPGYVEYKLAERFGSEVQVLLMQGTAGDVSPGGKGSGSQRMEDVGYRVAETAFRLYQAVTGASEAAFVMGLSREIPIQVRNRRIPISHELLGYESDQFHHDGAILCLQEYNNSCPADGGDVPPASFIKASSCLAQALEGRGKYHTDLTVVKLGELTIATLPGEASSEIGRQVLSLAEEHGAGETLLYAYAQDHNGYILMPDDWLRGGYEPTISYWGWRFAPYMLEQVADLFRELGGEKPLKRFRPPAVERPDMGYEPVAPAASLSAPEIVEQPVSSQMKLKPVTVRFSGGDPLLGLPRVLVERQTDAGFEVVLFRDWRPLDNYGYEIVTEYQATPSHATNPDVKSRDQIWTAVWEVPPWVSQGTYRFRITGSTVRTPGGAVEAYELTSSPVEVTATSLTYQYECDADGDGSPDTTESFFRVETTATELAISVAAFYRQAQPVWDHVFTGGDDQLANFRAWSELGSPRFPVAGPLTGKVRIVRDGSEIARVELEAKGIREGAKVEPACSGDDRLPRLEATYALPGPGSYVVRIEAGDVVDPFGNALEGAESAPIVLP